MILPDNLHPLPVSFDGPEGGGDREVSGFVSDQVVQQLLVGPLTLGGRAACHRGRADDGFASPRNESPFVSLAAAELHGEEPAKAFGAAEARPEARRKAAPPRPRRREPVEPPPTSRPWVISAGMLVVGFCAGCFLFALRPPAGPEIAAPIIPPGAEPLATEEEGPALVSAHSTLP